MSEMNWTPGPWHVMSDIRSDGNAREIVCGSGNMVATTDASASFSKGQRARNARLIAAAPELYAALDSALWIANVAADADINGRKAAGCVRDGITSRVKTILAALAKARGGAS